jgi:phosphoglucosamine mutase
LLQLTVPGVRANAGVALDGDGDRLVMVDHLGRVVDGDQLLFILATARKAANQLQGPVVGTVMSNLGLEHALAKQGIEFHRAKVGDRYVLEMMRATGSVLGGETSGHLLSLDHTTTGDAMIVALQVLAIMKQTGKSLAELAAGMPKYPQVMENVRIASKMNPDESPFIQDAIKKAEEKLAGNGRIVLRASGTEPLIRVTVEGRDEAQVKTLARELADAVRAAAR